MNYYIIPSAFLIALLLTFLFSILSRRGPWRALFIFFFIIFLVSWASQLWITPFGPVIWGIAWLPPVFIGILFSFLIIALLPPAKTPPAGDTATSNKEESGLVIGMFFWFLIILLLTSIVVGYYRIPPLVDPLVNAAS